MDKSEELQSIPKDFIIDDKYKIVLFIKKGESTESYRVKNSDGKLLFLKLFELSKLHRTSFDSNGNVLEVEILRNISHANIVNYKDSGEFVFENRRFGYLVLSFIVGETLAARITRENVSTLYDAKFYVQGVLNGLKYLHSLDEPIIHNEITLSNVMLDLSGTIPIPKLIDFGFARPFHKSSKTFNRGGINLYYLATESFNNVFSPQSDIFSAGALLYQLIYGFPPWYKALSKYVTDRTKLEEVLIEERAKPLLFPDVSEKFPDFDVTITNIIKTSLHQDTELRFKSADQFIKALSGEIEIEDPDRLQLQTSQNEFSKPKIKHSGKQIGKGFSAIAGMKTLKQQLQLDVIDALLNPEEYQKYDVTIPNGILLYGPPRCGKTFFAQRFSEEVGFNFVTIKPSDLQSKYVNATQENIRRMFEQAEEKAPSIIFIDELDALVPNREGELHQMHASAVNEFLAQMNNTGDKGIFIIGATNRPEKIDPAILGAGRLDKKFYVPPPDFDARKAMFELYLKKKPLDFGIDYDKLARLTENYVSGDIKLLVDDSARKALKLKERISIEILESTINEVKPSIPLVELNKYEQLRKTMEGSAMIENKRNPIGFKRTN
jgi:transitional endoplasmic reticulum ATPase